MPYFIQALLAAAIFTLAQSASALPSLGQITGDVTLNTVLDDGTELFSFTDFDSALDDSDMLITLRNAGGQNRVFVYDDLNPAVELTVFNFTDPVFAAKTLAFNVLLDQLSVGAFTLDLSNANGIFGVGIEHSDGNKYYSQNALNTDGFDHMLAFNVSAVDGSLFSLGNYVLAWEDLPNGGDQDWNDVLINATDIEAATAVDAPATMALFGLGLLGMSRALRKKA